MICVLRITGFFLGCVGKQDMKIKQQVFLPWKCFGVSRERNSKVSCGGDIAMTFRKTNLTFKLKKTAMSEIRDDFVCITSLM